MHMTREKQQLDMETVYNDHFSMVYNYVYYKLLNRENTEDIVSQIFMKVFRHLGNYDEKKASLKTWIFRIADNTLTDFYRRQRLHVSMDDEGTGLGNILHIHFDDQYEKACSPVREMLREALEQLPERDRTFVYYKYYLGLANREIARRLDMNENTVAAILARARKKLKDILGEEI